MNKTKAKILTKSLELLNEFGRANVSQRRISAALGISPGNLTYHFKKKEDIETALYFLLVKEMDGLLVESKQLLDFSKMVELIDTFLSIFYKYRFIFLDFTQLMRNNAVIAEHYMLLTKQRELQFLELFETLIEQKLLRPAELPDEYQNLYLRLQIIGDFWLAHEETLNEKLNGQMIDKYRTLILQMLYPYLVDKDMFRSMFLASNTK